MRKVLVGLLVLVLLAGGAVGLAGWAYVRPGPVAAEGQAQSVVLLDRGMGVKSIAARLKAANVIDQELVFAAAARLTGAQRNLKAGEYAIPSEASLKEVLAILVDGTSILHPITIAEGLTSKQIVAILNESDKLTGELTDIPAEGTLLPETYHFTRGTDRSEIIKRMQNAQRKLVDELWDKRASGLTLKTREEAVILASIVEKETGIASERPQVAATFHNRLTRGMRLQSDPTIIYGLTGGEPLGRGIRKSELDRKTAYNTYQIDGLPPTPISNPGAEAIKAVLNPPTTTHLYFVADGSGGHVFASSLKDHLKNVAQWRKIERAKKQQTGSN